MYSTKDDSVIRYSQCWEDTELVMSALEIKSTDCVISITSGGCNTLALLSKKPEKIFTIDSNPVQMALFELKLAAINQLNYSELIEFLGIGQCDQRLKYYLILEPHLSADTRDFWMVNPENIKKGIIHVGKFEKYLDFFRKYIHPLIHSRKIISQLQSIHNKHEQQEFYDHHWNNIRWRLIFRIFFSRMIMYGNGRSSEMFHFSLENSIGKEYFRRTEKAIARGNISSNRYLNYMLYGNFNHYLPYYLNPINVRQIKEASSPVMVNSDLCSFLKTQPVNSIDKFNLSDIFEALSTQHTHDIFDEIFRVAKPGARLLFWNNLVNRDVPNHLKSIFKKESELMEQLSKDDKIFFYASFSIYTINK